MKIKDPYIAKEVFDNISTIKLELNYDKWVEFIENNFSFFIWLEDTEKGKKLLAHIDEVPESFKEGVLKSHNKQQACAEFNKKKGYYEILIQFNNRLNVIGTTFQKRITKKHLQLLFDMANYLDAYLLNDGTEIIDQKFIDSLV